MKMTTLDAENSTSNFKELAEIENLLRCPICYEFIDTAMIIPQCSHNYCSLCIRRHISYKNQCPTCNKTVSVPLLRNNRLLDELIHLFKIILVKLKEEKWFKSVDTSVLSVTKSENPPVLSTSETIKHSPVKSWLSQRITSQPSASKMSTKTYIRQIETCAEIDSDDEILSTSVSPKVQKENKPVSSSMSCLASLSSPASSLNTSRTDERPQVLSPTTSNMQKVSCPVCGVDIPQRNINLHLDKCLDRDEKKESLRSSTAKRKPMTKYVYSLMKDKELRKKVAESGLPTDGDRHTLIRRHTELTLRYNAQCDSLNPKSAQEIIRELLDAEKSKSISMKSPKSFKLSLTKGESAEQIQVKQNNYVSQHKSQFQQLIADTKHRMREQKMAKEKQKSKTTAERVGTSDGLTDRHNKNCENSVEICSKDTTATSKSAAIVASMSSDSNYVSIDSGISSLAGVSKETNICETKFSSVQFASQNKSKSDLLFAKSSVLKIKSSSASTNVSGYLDSSNSDRLLYKTSRINDDESIDTNGAEYEILKSGERSPGNMLSVSDVACTQSGASVNEEQGRAGIGGQHADWSRDVSCDQCTSEESSHIVPQNDGNSAEPVTSESLTVIAVRRQIADHSGDTSVDRVHSVCPISPSLYSEHGEFTSPSSVVSGEFQSQSQDAVIICGESTLGTQPFTFVGASDLGVLPIQTDASQMSVRSVSQSSVGSGDFSSQPPGRQPGSDSVRDLTSEQTLRIAHSPPVDELVEPQSPVHVKLSGKKRKRPARNVNNPDEQTAEPSQKVRGRPRLSRTQSQKEVPADTKLHAFDSSSQVDQLTMPDRSTGVTRRSRRIKQT